MVLGIISDCIHVRKKDGTVGSQVHVFVNQMDHLSAHFDKVYMCAPVIEKKELDSKISIYSNKHIEFLPIPLAGGSSFISKMKIVFVLPIWIYKLIQVCIKSDVVFLRAPNNISIPGFLISRFFGEKRFSTFTGTWSGYGSEPLTYSLQRKYLSKYFEGPVFVYGNLPSDRKNIYNTISPSYTMNDWHEETDQVENRLKELADQEVLNRRINLITVGSLTDNKNQIFILKAMSELKKLNVNFVLWVAGDGENLKKYQDYVAGNNLQECVFFLGNIKQNQLREYYRKSDLIIQSPIHEGFGKVPVEGFFHGVIPIISDVNVSGNLVGDGARGRVFNSQDELIEHIQSLMQNTAVMMELIKKGREYAKENTLEAWGNDLHHHVKEMNISREGH